MFFVGNIVRKPLFLLYVAFLFVFSLVAESAVVQSHSGATIIDASTDDSLPELMRPIANLTVDTSNTKTYLAVNVEGVIVNPNSFPVYNVSIGLRFSLFLWRMVVPIDTAVETRTINIGTMASNKEVHVSKQFTFSHYAGGGLQLQDFVYYVKWDEPADSSPTQTTESPSDTSTDSEIISQKPPVPEFTVELVAYPYDVAPVTTTKIDQYTGEKTVKTTPGYRVENRSIEITIKNQPFTPYVDSDGNETNLCYNVRAKGHFGDEWEELSSNQIQSSSEYTVLSLSADYPNGGQIDFQVEAVLGHFYTAFFPPTSVIAFPYEAFKVDETSGWSSTQTLTISYEHAIVVEPETPDTPPTTDDTTLSVEPKSEKPSDSGEQGTLDLTWVPKDESVKVEEVAVLVGIAAVFAAIAVGLVYFKLRKR